jgi:shikimate dehydrogenase
MQTAAFAVMGINAVYVPMPCATAQLQSLIQSLTEAGGGGNVTLPHKAAAAQAVDVPSDLVVQLGACNTFCGDESGSLGFNTDVTGIEGALAEIDAPASTWLVVGTGGSARAVVEAARRAGASLAVRSRSVVKAARFLEMIASRGVAGAEQDEAEVIINATPLGRLENDPAPVELQDVPGAKAVLDLVYARGRTSWIRRCRQAGLQAEDGRAMLVAQGAAAFQHWFPGLDAPRDVMRGVVEQALRA